MLTRFWQHRYRGLMATLLIGLAGAIVVMLLPARQQASARVKLAIVGESSESARASVIKPVDALLVLDHDRVIARVLERVDPDIVDPIDPRPVDPKVAFRRYFMIKPAGAAGEFDIAFTARTAPTASKVMQTWLQAVDELLPDLSPALPGLDQPVITPSPPPAPLAPGRNGARMREAEAQVVSTQARLAQARQAVAELDAQAEQQARNEPAARPESPEVVARRLRAVQRELDDAIAANGAAEATLAATPQTVIERIEQPPAAAPPPRGVDRRLQAKVQEAEAALAALRVTYTDSHPDVRRQMAIVAEARAERDAAAGIPPAPVANAPTVSTREVPNPAYREAQREAAVSRRRVATLKARLSELETAATATVPVTPAPIDPARRQALLDTVTALEGQLALASAERDRLFSAAPGGTAGQAEPTPAPAQAPTPASARQRVAFEVLVPPAVQPAATNPDRPIWLMRVLGISLALGALSALLLSMRRTTYHDLRDLDRSTGLRSLGAVPRFSSVGRRFAGLARLLGYILLVLLYVLAFLTLIGTVSAGIPWQEIGVADLRAALGSLLQQGLSRLEMATEWLSRLGGAR